MPIYAKKSTKLSKSVKRNTKSYRKKGNKNSLFKATGSYGIAPEPFPRVLYTLAKYNDNKYAVVVPAYGISTARSYRMNSIYDPDFTGVGKTVAGWAQLSALYSQYQVLGARVNVTFSDPSTDGITVGMSLRQGSNSPLSGLTLDTIQTYNNVYMCPISNTGNQKKTFSFNIKPWQLIGIDKLEYMANSSRYSSTMSSYPNNSCYIDVFTVNNDPALPAATVNYTIKVVYHVKCFDRIQLNASSVS